MSRRGKTNRHYSIFVLLCLSGLSGSSREKDGASDPSLADAEESVKSAEEYIG